MRNVMLMLLIAGNVRVFRIMRPADQQIDRRILQFASMVVEFDGPMNATVVKDRFGFFSPNDFDVSTEDTVVNWIAATCRRHE